MQKQIQSAGKRGFFSKKSVGPQPREKFTFEDMLCFQKVIICYVSQNHYLLEPFEELRHYFTGSYTYIVT